MTTGTNTQSDPKSPSQGIRRGPGRPASADPALHVPFRIRRSMLEKLSELAKSCNMSVSKKLEEILENL